MATKKRKSPLKGRKHTHQGTVKKHKRRVNGINPSIVSGVRRKRHKRKISGITGNDFLDALLGTGVGVVVGVVFDRMVPIDNVKAKKGLETALGLAAAYYGSTKKNNFILGIGLGVAADGIKGTAHEFGVIQGMENIMSGMGIGDDSDDSMVIEMNGVSQQNMMSGMNDNLGIDSNVMGNAMPSVIG